MYESDIDLIHLQKQLVEHFNLSELKTLCFELGINYDDLAGDTLTDKTRELVKFGHRGGRVPEIVAHCQAARPHVDWSQPARIYRHDELPDEWVEPVQRLHRLVRAFNRNRHQPYSDERTRQGDEIAFTMREAAPFLFDQFDVREWLDSSNAGKRLAAIKYLDWLQDVEFLGNLLGKLATESPFIQLHILLAIDGLVDQMDSRNRRTVSVALTAYSVSAARDSDREYWRKRILAALSAA
jgi:hypothetical protein